jgi:hypothetical protein
MARRRSTSGGRQEEERQAEEEGRAMSDTLTDAQANILWGRAGGRCSNPICTGRVDKYKTHRIGNVGERAHLYGKKVNAARHDPNQTPKQRGSIENHLLLCQSCHKMIDDDEDQYPAELLVKWKAEHEGRVKRLLDLGMRARPTRILRMNARFGGGEGRVIPATDRAMQDAVLDRGYWIPEESILDINVESIRRDHESSYWQLVEEEVGRQFDRHLGHVGSQAKEHLSVFASGPIPLLILLGKLLGDTRGLHLYDWHRAEETWTWPSDNLGSLGVSVVAPPAVEGSEAVLLLGISGTPREAEVFAALGGAPLPVFRLQVPEPAVGLVRTPEHLGELRKAYQAVMQDAREKLGHEGLLHVFPAAGLSAAVAFGQTILPKVGPRVVIYDYNQAAKGWIPTLRW